MNVNAAFGWFKRETETDFCEHRIDWDHKGITFKARLTYTNLRAVYTFDLRENLNPDIVQGAIRRMQWLAREQRKVKFEHIANERNNREQAAH